MNKETQPIDRETLLKEANKIIREHEDTLAGIEATGVTQRNGVLVFTGDYFLDEQGLPTAKSLSLIHISEPTRLDVIAYAVFGLKI
ncbi:DUF2498 family protein, partial [Escherichia coli]